MGACTRTTPIPASSTGPCRRAPTSTPRPPSRTPPASARPSTRAHTTAPSMPSTPAPGTSSWSFHAGGRISGSATIIGRIVYFADLGDTRTYGLGVSTGRVLFEKNTGAFDPVISDSEHVYLTGYTSPVRARAEVDARGPQRACTRPRAERPREREARRHARASGAAQLHLGPSVGRPAHAPGRARERPVGRVAHPHKEAAGAGRLDAELVVAEIEEPAGTGQQGLRAEHAEDAPVASCGTFRAGMAGRRARAHPRGRSRGPAGRPAAPRSQPPASAASRSRRMRSGRATAARGRSGSPAASPSRVRARRSGQAAPPPSASG